MALQREELLRNLNQIKERTMNISAIYSQDAQLLTLFTGDSHSVPLNTIGLERDADSGIVAERLHQWAVSNRIISSSEQIAVC